MFPVSCTGDNHVCPMMTPATPPIPHVGGPVVNSGQAIVRIMGRPVAVAGAGITVCSGMSGPDPITQGSPVVKIMGMPVARVTSLCSHGGTLVTGSPLVRCP